MRHATYKKSSELGPNATRPAFPLPSRCGITGLRPTRPGYSIAHLVA